MGDVQILFKMAESTDEVKGQFLFCPVCRLNHDQGRKHIYKRKHKTLLGKILLKFGKKVSSLQRNDVCIHNSEEKQTNIFKIQRNLFTPTDQNILLILEFLHFFFLPVDTIKSSFESLKLLLAGGRHQGIPGHLHNDDYLFVDRTCFPNPGGLSLEILPQKGEGDPIPCPWLKICSKCQLFLCHARVSPWMIGHLQLENYL